MKRKSGTFSESKEPIGRHVPTVPSLPALKKYSRDPELAPIRRLQIVAILIAVIWVAGAAKISHHLVESVVDEEFQRQNDKAGIQAALIAQLIEKELHLAEQIAIALSHEADILKLTRQMNDDGEELAAMTSSRRKAFIKSTPQVQTVDNLFDRLQNNIDLYSVFLLDEQGNCIASGYQDEQKGRKRGCWGGNYAQRHYFKQAKRKGDGHQFAVGKRVPIPSLFFARAILVDTQFIGVVVVRIDAGKLVNSLRGEPSVTWMMDRHGMIISSTQDDLLFHHIGKVYHSFPSKGILKAVYARESVESIPLKRDKQRRAQWNVWRLGNVPMVFRETSVKGRDFNVWYGFNVESSLAVHTRSRYFAVAIIVAGLLLIFVLERMADFYQRRLVNMATLAEMNRSLESVSNRLYDIATKDHLTQISSRGYFLQRLDSAMKEAKRLQSPLSLMQLDIDFFKRINDTYGHPTGDAAIHHMAEQCREAVRGRDLVGRMGGEEFAICLIDCDSPSALTIADKLRESIATTPLSFEGKVIWFTCSIGIGEMTSDITPEQLLSSADRALYRAKEEGRNCVRFEGKSSVISE